MDEVKLSAKTLAEQEAGRRAIEHRAVADAAARIAAARAADAEAEATREVTPAGNEKPAKPKNTKST